MLARHAIVMILAGAIFVQLGRGDEFVGSLAGWGNVQTDFGAVGRREDS